MQYTFLEIARIFLLSTFQFYCALFFVCATLAFLWCISSGVFFVFVMGIFLYAIVVLIIWLGLKGYYNVAV